MGKTAPLKNKASTSVRSRAAKRASSPSIDTDKSLKNVKAPAETVYNPQILSPHQGAGVSKKKSGKQLSSKAKKRQNKGMDRAEAVMDRTSTKIEKSKYRGRNVQERAKTWEALNKKAQEAVQAAMDKENEVSEEEGDVDVEDDQSQGEIEMDGTSVAPVAPAALQSAPLPTPVEDEEEIL
ncbi:uncharacterized protein Bfra_002103 [Botrytis fragariae]|uniref:Ribosome biogenesis protein Alb1 n=1 Tax=Botrytis fragariae TaxID=1964551 RepID=A0A8H6B225_9HELO|nr:uncharacterized protein Bfra_002103 [Botrytis fragariae]KAF5877735.1 hypothetical protein Bfra_002103 [Botrytis fragariae]